MSTCATRPLNLGGLVRVLAVAMALRAPVIHPLMKSRCHCVHNPRLAGHVSGLWIHTCRSILPRTSPAVTALLCFLCRALEKGARLAQRVGWFEELEARRQVLTAVCTLVSHALAFRFDPPFCQSSKPELTDMLLAQI